MKRFPVLLLAVLGIILAACSPAGTEAPSALNVKSVLPEAGATNAPVNTTVLVEFSGALDVQTLTDSVALVSAGGAVKGTYDFDAAANKLTFVPDEALAYGTEYTVGLSDWLRSQSGATLASAVAWSFTTEQAPQTEDEQPETENPGDEDPADETPGNDDPEDETPGNDAPEDETPGNDDPEDETPGGDDPENETPGDPEYLPGDRVPADLLPEPNDKLPSFDETEVVLPGVVSVFPEPWTFAIRTTTVEVVFDREFDPSVLEAGVTVQVYNEGRGTARSAGGNQEGSESVTLIADGDTVSLSFDTPLEAGAWYWIYLDIDLEDVEGNLPQGSAKWLFRTLDY